MENVQLARYFDQSKNIEVIITVNDYHSYINEKNKKLISDFVVNRLSSRYITPFKYDDEEGIFRKKYKNGFSMMASYCLLIETLQSFKNGWGDSDRKSNKAFVQFFSNNSRFKELDGKGTEIYKHIRCGILHQGETTAGWKITREGLIFFDPQNKVIDTVLFGLKLEESIDDYRELLLDSKWDSELWDNFRTKMRKTISHCKV